MEREKPREKPKETELAALKRELARLRELKRQKELIEKEARKKFQLQLKTKKLNLRFNMKRIQTR